MTDLVPPPLGSQWATIDVPTGIVRWHATVADAYDTAAAAIAGMRTGRIYVVHIAAVLFADAADSAEAQAAYHAVREP